MRRRADLMAASGSKPPSLRFFTSLVIIPPSTVTFTSAFLTAGNSARIRYSLSVSLMSAEGDHSIVSPSTAPRGHPEKALLIMRVKVRSIRLKSRQARQEPIHRICGSLLGTGRGWDFGRPTTIGATGTQVEGSRSAAFPSGVESHPCESPIQHVPSPAAHAASIRFSAASEQFSTAHRLAVTLAITIRAGAR